MMPFDVHIVPALSDNYIYLLTSRISDETVVIDPSAAAPVRAFLGERPLHHILITHHHADHIGGVKELQETYGCPISASAYDCANNTLPFAAEPLTEQRTFTLLGEPVHVLDTPGHTLGHICYFFPQSKALFAADTLFVGGCGRVFEGTHAMMFASLMKLKALPDDTRLYCGHEYTVANLAFACHTHPEDITLRHALAAATAKRQQGQPTVPSLLGDEKRWNLFLRAESVAAFSMLRNAKDVF